MALQFVQLRCRSATRWPTDARLDAIAGGASKPGKRHRHCAKRRRYAMAPPVLQVAFSAAGRAARPLQPMANGLRGNDRSLNACQKLLRFRQGQSQVRNIANTFRAQISIRSVLRQRAPSPVAINRNTHRIPVPPVGYRPDRPYLLPRHTPSLWTLPIRVTARRLGTPAMLKNAMSNTPFIPVQISSGQGVHTWVKSQWKNRPLPGQFSAEINGHM